MFDKFTKAKPITDYYIGTRIRKEILSTREMTETGLSGTATIKTYISSKIYLYQKQDDKYIDVKLKKVVPELEIQDLFSLEIEVNDLYQMPIYNKNDIHGVYGIMNLKDVIDNLKVQSTLENDIFRDIVIDDEMTLIGIEMIVSTINKFLGNTEEYIDAETIKFVDNNRNIKDYPQYKELDDLTLTLNPFQIKGIIKNKNTAQDK